MTLDNPTRTPEDTGDRRRVRDPTGIPGGIMRRLSAIVFVLLLAGGASAQESYDLLLRGGHVIDPGHNLSAVRDVAIRDRKIAAVAPAIDPARALKTIDVA